jgi:ABC-type transport system involved in multi-copper enzyme maturation permease subunit
MLRNFIAVMKDSFREAVDGFIIYVMLGLAVLTILVAASVSYEPDKGDTAFNSTVGRFNQAFASRGTDIEEIGTRIKFGPFTERMPFQLLFTAADVQKLDAGSEYPGRYKMRVSVVAGEESRGPRRAGEPPRPPTKLQDGGTIFPTLVYAWSQAKTPEQFFLVRNRSVDEGQAKEALFELVPEGANPDEALEKKGADGSQWTLVAIPKVSPAELKSLSDETMCDFIKNQFMLHGDIPDANVARVKGAKDLDYTFDVEVTVPAGAKGWPYTTKIFFGGMTIGQSQPFGPAHYGIQDVLVNTIGASITLLVSVILTGFFIPNMLRKGSLDLLMAKPMSRWELLLYKYIGGLMFMFLVTATTVGGVWLVMAMRSGNWNPTFLLSIPVITFTFAVLYAVSTLVAVLTRSAIAAILITAFFMVLMWGVGFAKSISDNIRAITEKQEDKQGWFYTAIDVSNAVLPRYNDILKLNSATLTEAYYTPAGVKVVKRTEQPSWFSAGGVSVAYILVLLGFSYWRFATRDP